jgi:two-component system cell cycle sensor histidine kinase/response regulator CckA
VTFDAQGAISGLISVGMDMTERLQLEEQLLQQAKTESLGRLAAGLAHDFNNLLTVILGQATLLGRHASGPAAEQTRAALDAALKQASELTQSMLVYARRQPEARQRTDLDAVLREIAPLVMAVAGESLSVTTAFRAEGAQVLIDPTRLRQVLLNLVSNAADATRGFGKRIQVSTHVELVDAARARAHGARDGGEFVVLTVADDGPGMDPETASRIFEPFFTTKGSGSGTGLGMPICQSIVQRANGFLEVHSQLGQGATFQVFLPVAEGPERPAASLEPGLSGVAPGPQQSVLLALSGSQPNDLAPALRSAGYDVLVAHGSRSAAHHLGSHHVDFLVVEGAHQASSSYTLARSARAVHPRLRVILVTPDPEQEYGGGYDAVVLEPLDAPKLLTALAGLVRRGRGAPRT